MGDFTNDVGESEINNFDFKNRFEQTANKLIQENNVDIVSKLLFGDVINQSVEELKDEETEKNNLLSIT